jgi:hypothetical protein
VARYAKPYFLLERAKRIIFIEQASRHRHYKYLFSYLMRKKAAGDALLDSAEAEDDLASKKGFNAKLKDDDLMYLKIQRVRNQLLNYNEDFDQFKKKFVIQIY